MRTINDIFTAFQGPARVGRAIGKTTEHANAMRRRRSIPVRYWPKLIDVARENGIEISEADLVRIHTPVHVEEHAAP